jgi:hypothetical protein
MSYGIDADEVVLIRTWLPRPDTAQPPSAEYQRRRWAAHARLSGVYRRAEIEVAAHPWPAKGEPTAITADDVRHFDGALVEEITALVLAERSNGFVELCQLADRESWCWNLHCTTCGHMHWRYGLYELSLGRVPDASEWLTHKHARQLSRLGGLKDVTEALLENCNLPQILAEADLVSVAETCRFPDYLGYLGIALAYARRCEERIPVLTDAWPPQLKRIVMNDSDAATMLDALMSQRHQVLVWKDLESIERAIRPEYATRRSR